MRIHRLKDKLRIAALSSLPALFLIYLPVSVNAQSDVSACIESAKGGLLEIPDDRSKRFLGKVEEATARCRGGDRAVKYRHTPWVDWQNYYATADAGSRHDGKDGLTLLGKHLLPNGRGIDGALLDLEYQRIELIKFNLFDQLTYEAYVKGVDGRPGATLKQWHAMRLPPDHSHYRDVGGEGKQLCNGDLITHRTLTG
ncbi:MAG: hypothetical protein U9Q75_09450, partial [Pseudomonadota bacterium]|nr:hypothetical protein [Pseudomonadota bacterium]